MAGIGETAVLSCRRACLCLRDDIRLLCGPGRIGGWWRVQCAWTMEEARLRSLLLVPLLRAMPPKISVHVECASFEA